MAQSQFETLFSFGVSSEQTLLQHFYRGWIDENVVRFEVGLLHLLDALHLDVQDADLAVLEDGLDGRLAGTVQIPAERRVLDELTVLDGVDHRRLLDEMVMDAVLFADAWLPGGVAYAESELFGMVGHQAGQQGALAGPGWTAHDYRT